MKSNETVVFQLIKTLFFLLIKKSSEEAFQARLNKSINTQNLFLIKTHGKQSTIEHKQQDLNRHKNYRKR